MVVKGTFSELLVALWDVNIKVALQKYSFDAEYTIGQLPTDDQHVKDGFCGKNW